MGSLGTGGVTLLFHCAKDYKSTRSNSNKIHTGSRYTGNVGVPMNIALTGLDMFFASNGRLGKGLYGAVDPRKAFTYSNAWDKIQNRRPPGIGVVSMFIFAFNTSAGI